MSFPLGMMRNENAEFGAAAPAASLLRHRYAESALDRLAGLRAEAAHSRCVQRLRGFIEPCRTPGDGRLYRIGRRDRLNLRRGTCAGRRINRSNERGALSRTATPPPGCLG